MTNKANSVEKIQKNTLFDSWILSEKLMIGIVVDSTLDDGWVVVRVDVTEVALVVVAEEFPNGLILAEFTDTGLGKVVFVIALIQVW